MIVAIIILLGLMAIIALFVAGIKNESNKGGEDMIKKVYIYLVLFATLMMAIGGSVAAFMAAADIISPAPYSQSFEEFKQVGTSEKSELLNKQNGETAKLSDAELQARYSAMVAGEKERQIDRAKNSLIKSLGWIIIPLPVFIFFQRRLTRDA